MLGLKRMFQVLSLGLISVVFFLFFGCFSSAQAASPIVVKISHSWAQEDLRHQWAVWFSQMVEERAKGAFKFEIYPSAVLYKAVQQMDALRTGTLDMMVYPLVYATGKIPEFLITTMPCFPRNISIAVKWRDAEIGRMIQKICLDNGFRELGVASSMGGLGSKKKLVVSPDDLKGLKMRGAGAANEEMLRAAGAAITSMPTSEVYFALQTGVLDGLMTSYSSFQSFRLYEVLDNLLVGKDGHLFSSQAGIYISNKTWDRLSKEHKDIFAAAGLGSGKRYQEEILKEDEGVAEVYIKNGVKVHYLSEAEFKIWEDLGRRTAWKTFVEKVKNGKQLMDAALAVK